MVLRFWTIIVFRWTEAGPEEVEIGRPSWLIRGAYVAKKVRSRRLPPVHSGEILREEYLRPTKSYALCALAKAIGVPRKRIERLAAEKTPVTADTSLRLARYLGPSARLWMNMQPRHGRRGD